MALLDGRGGLVTFDSMAFHEAGLKMFSSEWAETFADPSIQEGPIVIMVYGILGHLARILSVDPKYLLALVVETGFTLGLMVIVKGLLADRSLVQPDVELYVGLLAILGFVSWNAFGSGHIAEAIIPLIWLEAIRDIGKGREVKAGMLLGLSAALKTWGVLGIVLTLFASRPRRALRAAGPAVAVSILPWIPFVIFGKVSTFAYEWAVQVPSLVRHVIPINTPVPWTWRIIQGAAAMSFVAFLIFVFKRSPEGPWLTVTGLVAMRLVLDPTYYYYYIVALSVLCLVGAAVVFPTTPQPLRVLKVAVAYLFLHPIFLLKDQGLALWSLALCVAVSFIFIFTRRRESLLHLGLLHLP